MPRHHSRSRSRSRSASPLKRKRYDEPREHRRDERSSGPCGLLVRNISLDARPEDIRIPFEKFGPVKDVYLPRNYYTREPRGFGFVKFCNPDDAADAKYQLDRAIIGGREIRIVYAEENRKSPLEMRRVPQSSSRRSYRRRSPSYSPRRRQHSNSRSRSPARRDSRSHRARDDYESSRRSRHVSRSVSPWDDRNHRSREKSPKPSRSPHRSISPSENKNHKHIHSSDSPRKNGDVPSRSQSPSRQSRSPIRSHLRSNSPR